MSILGRIEIEIDFYFVFDSSIARLYSIIYYIQKNTSNILQILHTTAIQNTVNILQILHIILVLQICYIY